MAPRTYISVKRELLQWARNTAGFTLEEAARKIGVKPARLAAWEAGESAPTAQQLRSAANAYKRPLGAFFLPAAPKEPAPPHDFRRLYGDEPPAPTRLMITYPKAFKRRT